MASRGGTLFSSVFIGGAGTVQENSSSGKDGLNGDSAVGKGSLTGVSSGASGREKRGKMQEGEAAPAKAGACDWFENATGRTDTSPATLQSAERTMVKAKELGR